ncbi:SRPBCC family protein [Pontibacter vulgaris]|uniref:SRPBCC family protein n=1 Tax=Pontibacter vulgaris TaxID=2905679 RepID=UPI001FA7CA4F|nr:SRPBCC family protein [Pontibacter vulgaris]
MDTYNPQLSKVLQTDHISPPATGTSHQNVSTVERIVSAVGGGALTALGMRKSGKAGMAMALAGGALLFRGATGYCPMNQLVGRDTADGKDIALDATNTFTIMKPRTEVYQFWRQLENLPRFMSHLKEVRQEGPQRSHWVAKLPGGVSTVEWDADIVHEVENSLIAWTSLPGADVDNAGEVRFSDSPDGKGTIVQVVISYRPPAGTVGGLAARMINPAFRKTVKSDLRYLKRYLETGQVPQADHKQPLKSA